MLTVEWLISAITFVFNDVFSLFKAVTKAKLGYDPLEVNPEDMVRFAMENPQVGYPCIHSFSCAFVASSETGYHFIVMQEKKIMYMICEFFLKKNTLSFLWVDPNNGIEYLVHDHEWIFKVGGCLLNYYNFSLTYM